MDIQIQKIDSENKSHVDNFDRKFIVKEKIALDMENGSLTYSVVPVSPYEKEYPADEVEDATAFIDGDEKAIFLAFVDHQPAGQIKMITWWNRFAYIDDLVVNPQFRGLGVGKSLIAEAVRWSKAKRFPGVMLETQDNNVAACRLYQACGFILGGFDRFTFKNLQPNETALFWYLLF
ncbi:MAG: GNAT family N-acetyltransferase [Anaerolineales bacterium]|nr:GNAT family N-acetyltransferase [Anaerolineales bacterium]